jgi:peptide/nickel transport system substrate-binding protein
MFWLRSLIFASPLGLVFGVVLIFSQLQRAKWPSDVDALVTLINDPIGLLSPITPQKGIPREITRLMFEPLLKRGPSGELMPHLLESWETRTMVTIQCASEENAGASEAKLRAGEYDGPDLTILAVERLDDVISVILEGDAPAMAEALVARFDPGDLGDFQLVRLTLDHAIRSTVETFLATAVERPKVGLVEYRGDEVADLLVEGDPTEFIRELNLYLSSNADLTPKVEKLGPRCHTSGIQLVLNLREGVKWHDGKPVTARDLLFSFEAMTSGNTPLSLADSFRFLERMEVIDPLRVRATCTSIPPAHLEAWEKLPIFPAHRLESLASPAEWVSFFENPIGTGPYQISQRLSGGGIELRANESFPGGAPLQKLLRYRRSGSFESTVLGLQRGEIDRLNPDARLRQWSGRHPEVWEVVKGRVQHQIAIVWNVRHPSLEQIEIRNALAKCVDLTQALPQSFDEFASPTRSLFSPRSPYAKDMMPLPLHDPVAAARELDRAGFQTSATQPWREKQDGTPLHFTLAVNSANAAQLSLAEDLVDQWAQQGVAVTLESLAWSEILQKRLPRREFDAVLLGWELPLGRDVFALWHSSQAGPGGSNLSGIEDPELDRLLEALRRETKPTEVVALATKVQGRIAALQPCLFLCDTGPLATIRTGAVEIREPDGTGPEESVELKAASDPWEVRPWWVKRAVVQPRS